MLLPKHSFTGVSCTLKLVGKIIFLLLIVYKHSLICELISILFLTNYIRTNMLYPNATYYTVIIIQFSAEGNCIIAL